jgi:hypothetical protein
MEAARDRVLIYASESSKRTAPYAKRVRKV